MSEMKEIKLPSGSVLKISLVPFGEAKELFQVVMEELKTLRVEASTDLNVNFFKDLFAAGFSSKKIEKSLNTCMKRCLYNELKIDESTFEDAKAREDYLAIIFEVTKEVLSPFLKSLTALLPQAVGIVENIQK